MENIIEKTLILPLELYGYIKYLCDKKKEFVLSKQLLRSGTGIGANVAKGQQ